MVVPRPNQQYARNRLTRIRLLQPKALPGINLRNVTRPEQAKVHQVAKKLGVLHASKKTKTGVPPVGPLPSPGARTLPPDAQYETDIANAQQTRATSLANLTQSRQAELTGAGYTETNVDPNTGVGTLAFNPNDPFSRAALLKKTYDESRARTAQTLGAGGQLYSGAFQQAQDIGNRGQLQAEDAQQRALLGFLAQNTAGTTTARTNYDLAAIRAASARLGRIDTNPLYSPEATGTLKKKATKKPAKPKKPAAPKVLGPKPSTVKKSVTKPLTPYKTASGKTVQVLPPRNNPLPKRSSKSRKR